MRTLFVVALLCVAGLAAGCNGCGCEPNPCCEPVYVSPCCPAPSQGMGYGKAAPSPAPAPGAGGSCGSCGTGGKACG
jgi:hypothetical protein